jgi:signal transduction histidine kinase
MGIECLFCSTMISSMTTPTEQERLLELYHYDLLDTPADENFDEIVQLASQICKVPMSMITLVDSQRQWFKARTGFPDSETPREVSFCAHVVAGQDDIFIVEDATKDERFHDYPNVTGDPNIRFYAGVPLVSGRGHKLGSLCVINSIPQQLTGEQEFALKVLANQVMKLADQRLQNRYLDNYQKRLKQHALMQNRILSIIAHDIRTPLVSLQGIIDLTEEKIITEAEQSEMLVLWKKQLVSTMELLSNLVEWGKVHAGNDATETASIDLSKIVDDVLNTFNTAASAKGNTLKNNIDKGLLIQADSNIVEFLVRNLVANAIKFTEDGTITITAERNKNKLSVSVADTGVGMNAKRLEQLRDGKDISITRGTRKETGSGLGLMLVRDFLDMLDGRLFIKSEERKGTTIGFEILA